MATVGQESPTPAIFESGRFRGDLLYREIYKSCPTISSSPIA